MSIFVRLPWVSLALVLLTYGVFGWVLSAEKFHVFVWLLFAIAILILEGLLTSSSNLANYSSNFFDSKARSIGATFLGAFSVFIIVANFRIFLDLLLIVSAAILVRIDFQVAGFGQKSAFFVSSLFSLAGLALGAGLHYMLMAQPHHHLA